MIDLAAAPTSAENPGTAVQYVAANLEEPRWNLTGVEPFKYIKIGELKVASSASSTRRRRPSSRPGNFGTIEVTDGVAAATKSATKARKAGANVVIVITHKGMDTVIPGDAASSRTSPRRCPRVSSTSSSAITPNIQFSGTAANGVLYHENLSFGNTLREDAHHGPTPARRVGHRSAKRRSRSSRRAAGTLLGATTRRAAPPTFCDQAILDMLVPYRVALAARSTA